MASHPTTKNITLSSYSDNSIVVRDDTKPHKNQLKTLGDRWNPKLKNGAGWIYPKTKQDIVENYIKTGTNPESDSESDISHIKEIVAEEFNADWGDSTQRSSHIHDMWKTVSKQHGLFGWKFSLSSRMTSSGGVCYFSKKQITLSKIMIDHPKTKRQDAENTLLHEVAHAIDNSRNGVRRGSNGKRLGHDSVWKKIAKEIGCSGLRCHTMAFSNEN